MGWTLIRGGHIFDPEDRGKADLLLLDERIAAVRMGLSAPTGVGEGELFDAAGRVVLPGLIDGHIHVMGASGLGGPGTRTTDLQIERIAGVGVTTVVSPLGADSLSRTIPALLARALALEVEGISAYCYTGGWKVPVPTLTGDPQADVAFVERIVGVKAALSEPLAPAYPMDDLCRLAHAAYTGGRLAGKGAVLHTHIGDQPEGLAPLLEVHRRTGIPTDRLVATHVNRNPRLWEQALDFARAGGSIDLTGMQRPEHGHPHALPPARAIREALELGIPPDRLTLSSDSGAAYPRFTGTGGASELYMAGPDSLLETVRELVLSGLTWGRAASFATRHPADRLGLRHKGRIAAGADADLLLLTSEGEVDRVYCRGRLMVEEGRPIVRGPFEGHAPR